MNKETLNFIIELRRRLLLSLSVCLVVFIALCFVMHDAYRYLALPLLQQLPAGQSMIAVQVSAPLLVPLKFCWMLALFLSMPFVLYQLWCFITPALYQHEKRHWWSSVCLSCLLFYGGVLFAYYVALPLLLGFFMQHANAQVRVLPDVAHYLDFVLMLFLAFGLMFEVPVFSLALLQLGILDSKQLKRFRPYFIVGAFVLSMLLTPPDVLSQLLLAIPMCMLYEVSIVIGVYLEKRQQAIKATQSEGI